MIKFIRLDSSRFMALGARTSVEEHVRASLVAKPGSLADELHHRLAASLTRGLLDARHDYRQFFDEEFSSIEQYLRNIHELPHHLIRRLRETGALSGDFCIAQMLLSGDRALVDLIMSDQGIVMLKKLFSVEKESDEIEG